MLPRDFEVDVNELERPVIKRDIPQVGEYPVTEIRSILEELAETFGNKGGFIRLYLIGEDSKWRNEVFSEPFGIFDEPKKNRPLFEKFSQEKALRLFKNPEHDSSHQSRNTAKQLYGGAIRAKNFIVSCSGMSELEDEAFSLILAIRLGWIREHEANKIANKNRFYKKFVKPATMVAA